jgi:3-phytase/alkaline phosphatase D
VTFEYSLLPDFSLIIDTQIVPVADPTIPAKLEVAGLTPGTQYYYRATDGSGKFSSGRFRTNSSAGMHAGFRMGVSGDWRGELSPYPAVRNVPARNLDVFVALGDTIYADFPSPARRR